MALKKPSAEDQKKLHDRVNQITHQAILITTAAITVFGLFSSWLIREVPPSARAPVGSRTYALSMLLVFLLLTFFLLLHSQKRLLRILTTYLVITEASDWEREWKRFRERGPYWGYEESPALVFLALGLLSTIFPFLNAYLHCLVLEPMAGAYSLVIIGTVYLGLVWGMGFRDWWSGEESAITKWKALQDDL